LLSGAAAAVNASTEIVALAAFLPRPDGRGARCRTEVLFPSAHDLSNRRSAGDGEGFARCGTAGNAPSDIDYISLGDLRVARAIATSGALVCALFDSGRVKCWGKNAEGQLGIGTTDATIGDHSNELGNELSYVSID
jgi:hypothetical protein